MCTRRADSSCLCFQIITKYWGIEICSRATRRCLKQTIQGVFLAFPPDYRLQHIDEKQLIQDAFQPPLVTIVARHAMRRRAPQRCNGPSRQAGSLPTLHCTTTPRLTLLQRTEWNDDTWPLPARVTDHTSAFIRE